MKRFLLSFIALLSIVISAQAQNFEKDGISYNVIKSPNAESPGEVEVRQSLSNGGNGSGGYTGVIVIPDEVKNDDITYKVTRIGGWSFRLCPDLTSITIPNGVTSIGDAAFHGCSGLSSITIPNNVTTIEGAAFSECSGISSITIPNGVTKIESSTFQGCKSLSSIIIPDGVTEIGGSAFNNCSGLTSITIPKSVTKIGGWAFAGCSKLASIDISGITQTTIESCTFQDCAKLSSITIPNNVTKIEESAFSGCTSLTSLTIPDGVTKIGNSAFNNCASLTTLTIPNGVTKIGNSTFYGCTNLSSITIPDGVTEIGGSAFDKCSSLKSITIPKGVTKIENGTFQDCSQLTSVNVLSNQLTAIEGWAFYNCSSLASITIPNSVTSIGYSAFRDCGKLTSVIISDQLTTIEGWAFQGCTSLTSITIPSGVTTIGDWAFNNCNSLSLVTSEISTPFDLDNNVFNNPWSATLIVPKDSRNAYKSKSGWNNFALTYEKGEKIYDREYTDEQGVRYSLWQAADYSFFYRVSGYSEDLKSEIIIPNDIQGCPVKAIGDGMAGDMTMAVGMAFSGCKTLTKITIPSNVTSIGSNAFRDCINLTSVKMGKNVTNIGDYAFYNCSSLNSITLPRNLERIGNSAFSGDDFWSWTSGDKYVPITSITIPGSVETIGDGAFRGCRELALINFELDEDGLSNLTTIGEEAFMSCAFTSIIIPNSVTTIGRAAFTQTKLTTAILGNGITEIKDQTFQSCGYLSSVTIPDGVTSIGAEAFSSCGFLRSIKLPNSLTSMGEGVFSGCSMKSIELPDAFTVISKDLFKDNDFEYIKLGNNVKSIEKNAFGCRLMGAEEDLVVMEIGTSTPPEIAKDAFPYLEVLNVINVIVPDAAAQTAYKDVAVWDEMTYSNMENTAEVTVEAPGGSLGSDLRKQCRITASRVVKLKVKGTINVQDFNQMRTNMKSLISLDLSECDITEIPDGGLTGMIQLQELKLPTKLKTIGNWAFQDCPYLTGKLELPSGVTSIGNSAFRGTNYTEVTLPRTLQIIGDSAFYNLSFKQKLIIPDGMTSIGAYAFSETPIYGKYVIPDNIEYIGAGAFRNTQISLAFLPTGINSLSRETFQGCSILEDVYIPDNCTEVSDFAFDGCSTLETLRLSPNTASLGEYAFQNTKLDYFKVPSKVDVLPRGVLKNNRNLVSLSLPANLKSVEAEALYGCSALRNLSVEAIVPPTVTKSSMIGVNTDLCIISLPTISEEAYWEAEYWGRFVELRNDIDVETEGNGRIAFSCVEAETDTDEATTRGLSVAATRSENGISAEEAETESMTFTFNGSSVYVPKQGKVRFCIFPAAGEELLSATLDGVDIMPLLEIINGKYYYTATADKVDAKLVIKFSGEGQAEQSTVTAKSYKRVYGDPNPAFSFDVDGAELDGNPVVTCEATATSPVGTYPIVITKGTETNSVVTYVDGTLTITKAPLTIKAGTYYKKPGEENPAFTLTYDGFKNNETSAVLTKQPTVTCSATKDSPVGDYEVTVSGAEAQNYEISYVSGKLTVGTTDPSTNPDGDTEMITIGKSGKASYCGDKSLDFSFSEEVKAYIATGFDESEGTIWLTRVKDVPAGTPVMIKGVAEKTYNVPVTNSQNSYYKNMFKGNTSGDKIQVPETENGFVNYYLSGDGSFKSVKGYANIGNNKSYLQLPGTFSPTVVGGSQTVTIKSSGKASYAAPVDLDFTNVEGLKAFTATGLDKSNSTIWLTRVMKVQKGEGLLLKGAAGDYQIPSVAVQSSYQNMFVGNTSGNSIQVKETSDDGSLTNFYLKGDGTFVSVYGYVNIGNNKSYLALPTFMLTASTRGAEPRYILEEPEVIKVPISFRSLDNDGDGTTAIRETKQLKEDGAYYTLQGQRVQNPGKGLYIHNGKKVVIK